MLASLEESLQYCLLTKVKEMNQVNQNTRCVKVKGQSFKAAE